MQLKGPYDCPMTSRTLEDEPKDARGGKRRNSGRKTEEGTEGEVKKHTLTLDDMTMRKAKVLGGDEASRGVRAAVRYAYDAFQADRFPMPQPKRARSTLKENKRGRAE